MARTRRVESRSWPLQLGVLITVAEFDREIIRERVNAGLRGGQATRGKAWLAILIWSPQTALTPRSNDSTRNHFVLFPHLGAAV